ncbi:hypothetical protein H1R20_g12396, partial [Candolleomyces eurysporus]
MTPEGQPLYSIATPVERSKPESDNASSPNVPPPPNQSTDSIRPVARSHSQRRKALKSRTTINRLDHSNVSSGHVETTVGIITYPNSTPGIDSREQPEVALDLCEQKRVLTIEAAPFALDVTQIPRVEARGRASTTQGEPHDEAQSSDEEWVLVTEKNTSKTLQKKAKVEESSWDFVGPDDKHYKWQLLVQSPVLVIIDKTMVVPLARYRRAKLGIVSRPRKGFLEILPVGCPMMDLIVSTFVTFMKHWVLPLDIVEETSESIVSVITNSNRASSEGQAAPLDTLPPTNSQSSPPSPPIPSRFQTAAYLARKHSVSPLRKTLSLPPYARGAPLDPPSIVEINQ